MPFVNPLALPFLLFFLPDKLKGWEKGKWAHLFTSAFLKAPINL